MKLTILKIDKVIYDGDFEYVIVPGVEGVMTIYKNHTPILTMLKKGFVKYKDKNNVERNIDILGGVVEVNKDEVVVII